MKKFAILFAVTLLLAVADLLAVPAEKFIPEQSFAVIRLDVRRLIDLPMPDNAEKSSQTAHEYLKSFEQIKKEAAAEGIEPLKLFDGDVWIAKTGKEDDDFAIYSGTLVPETKLAAFLQKKGFVITTAANRRVYVFQEFALTYLTADVIMLAKNSDSLPLLITASQQNNSNPLLSIIDRKRQIAAVINGNDLSSRPGKKSKIKLIKSTLDIDTASTAPLALIIGSEVHFFKAKDAAKQAMQMQLAVPGMAGMLLANDEKLMQAVCSGFKVTNQENILNISFGLSGENVQKLLEYVANPANFPKPQPNSAVPPQGTDSKN